MKSSFIMLTSDIRFDSTLSANARLLYGEIVLLCKKEGHCWATNAYFSKLYGITIRSVQRFIGELKKAGYISLAFSYVDETRLIERREIRLCEGMKDDKEDCHEGDDNSVIPDGQICHGGMTDLSHPHDRFVMENIKNSKIKKEKEKRKKDFFVFGFSQNKKEESREKPIENEGIDPAEKAESLEDATTLFNLARDFWNSSELKPECRDLLIPPSKYGCLRTFQNYRYEEIKNAIRNYDWHVKGRCGQGFKPPPPYGSLYGFLENGVARYFDDDAIDDQFKEVKHGA